MTARRFRPSTLALSVVFIILLTIYLLVRPPPGATVAENPPSPSPTESSAAGAQQDSDRQSQAEQDVVDAVAESDTRAVTPSETSTPSGTPTTHGDIVRARRSRRHQRLHEGWRRCDERSPDPAQGHVRIGRSKRRPRCVLRTPAGPGSSPHGGVPGARPRSVHGSLGKDPRGRACIVSRPSWRTAASSETS